MNIDYDNLLIFLTGIGCALIVLAFMFGYMLGMEAMRPREK